LNLIGQIADSSYFNDSEFTPKEGKIYVTTPRTDLQDLKDAKKDNFFDSLKVRANQKSWSRQLHRLLVIDSRDEQTSQPTNGYDRTEYFEHFKGKEIRAIEIKQLDIFGPSVLDTTPKEQNWLQNLGNSLHISTHKSSLKTYLFFEEGEHVDPFLFADNERIFRTIPSLYDARIFIVPVEGNPDLVDIKIVTKDVWPIGVSGEVFDYIYGNVSLWSNNMLGLGHQLKYTAYYNSDPKLETNFGYKAEYSIPNVGNTFTFLKLFYEDSWNLITTKVHLDRDFIIPSIKFGGGLGYEKNYNIADYRTIDTVYQGVKSDLEFYDAWAGYSILIKAFQNNKLRNTFFATIRGMNYNYLIRPEVEENFLYQFHNRKIILGSIGLARQGFHNTRLVYGFGKTEDLPLGALLKITGGIESDEFTKRYYFGSSFSFSKYLKNFGYLANTFEFGSFYDNHPEQGSFKYNLLHISPLFGSSRHSFRHITKLEYSQGFNRFKDEYVSIFRNEGIRGLDYLQLKGNKKFYFNSELVYYSPHYLVGFRFVYFAFLDVGTINYKDNALLDNPVFSSVGLGVRIRNERLVFNTIQIRLSFFPFENDLPRDSMHFIEFSGVSEKQISNFAKKKPEIIEY
jgi:hypothetical protein